MSHSSDDYILKIDNNRKLISFKDGVDLILESDYKRDTPFNCPKCFNIFESKDDLETYKLYACCHMCSLDRKNRTILRDEK